MTETDTFPAQEGNFDLKKIIARVLRNWYWVVLSLILCYSAALIVNRYSDPMFTVSATLIINDEKKSTAEMLVNALDRTNARKNIENEIAILQSYRMAYKTVAEMGWEISYYKKGNIKQTQLYGSVPFTVLLDSSKYNSLGYPVNITLISKSEFEVFIDGSINIRRRLHFGQYFRHDAFNFTIILNNPAYFIPSSEENYVFVINYLNGLANQYASKINISPGERRGTILTLRSTGPVAQMEADYLNKLMEVYIRNGLEEKNQTAINTINFIDQQLANVVDSLKINENKLEEFKRQGNMMEISDQGKFLLDKMTEIQKDKAALEVELRYYTYLINYLKSKNDFSNVIAPSFMGLPDLPMSSQLSQLVELYKERKTLMMSATQTHPNIAQVDEKIQSSLDALNENISESVKLTTSRKNDHDYQLHSLETEMIQLPINERSYLNIQRTYKLNDQIYNFLLQKRADAAISKASNVADNKILDVARVENSYQISPKSAQNKTTGIMLGLVLPIGILVLLELFNARITSPDDIAKRTSVPVIGTIGHNEKDSELPVAANPQSAIAESFRSLRTNLQYYLRENDKKVICITSTISGEGKTFTAVNVAAIIAQSNKKTLLLSLDLRKPKVHTVFHLENELGLSNYLIEKASYEEVIHPTNLQNLYISMAGPVPPNPAELIETPRMEEFMRKASEEFDIIVMDTPPLAIVTDAMLLARFAHAMVFVVRLNYSAIDVLKLVEELRVKNEISNLGIVVNDIVYSSRSYGKKYGYRYGYSYGYGRGHGYYTDDAEHKPSWWRSLWKS